MSSKSFWPLICAQLLIVALVGCGGGASMAPPPVTPAAKPEFIYISTLVNTTPFVSTELSAYKLDTASGVITPAISVASSQFTLQFAVDPSSKFVYLSNPSIAASAIDILSIDPSTGGLTETGEFVFPTTICPFCVVPDLPGPLAMDPTGKFLFYGSAILSPPGQQIGSLTVNTPGNLNLVAGSPFVADPSPYSLVAHPSGKFVYTEDIDAPPGSFFGLQGVSGYMVAADGTLTRAANSPFPVPTGSNVGVLLAHPSGKFLYSTTGTSPVGLLLWSVNTTTGELSPLPSSPFMPNVAFVGAAMHPTGKFLYATLLSGPSGPSVGGLVGFSIDPNSGALTQLTGPATGDSLSSTLAIDPSGQYLFAVGVGQNAIKEFKIDATTGALTKLTNSVPLTAIPTAMSIVRAP
jgi:6-phosphogluconolactonase (cycloisomerase 2 family)